MSKAEKNKNNHKTLDLQLNAFLSRYFLSRYWRFNDDKITAIHIKKSQSLVVD